MKGFRGFTLVELMIVLAIMGVLLALTAPMGRFVNNNSTASKARDFFTTLNFARNTAITSGTTVVVCRLTVIDAITGERDCLMDGSNSWQGGWAVFIDANNDGTMTNGTTGGPDNNNDGIPDTAVDDDQIVQISGSLPDGYTLINQSAVPREIVRFSAMGLVAGFPTSWVLCEPTRDVELGRGIILARTGRTRLAEDIDGDRVRELSNTDNNSDITCI